MFFFISNGKHNRSYLIYYSFFQDGPFHFRRIFADTQALDKDGLDLKARWTDNPYRPQSGTPNHRRRCIKKFATRSCRCDKIKRTDKETVIGDSVVIQTCWKDMSILDQSRGLPHLPGLPPGGPPMIPPHPMEGPPSSDVLLALLARNKALEGESKRCWCESTCD